MQLEPCPACKRHVRTEERVCPFCAADIASTMARAPKRAMPGQRLGRAALMSFGITAAALTGCEDDSADNGDAQVQPDASTRDASTGSDASLDARVPDAATPDASAPVDASVPADASTQDAKVPDASVDAGRDSGEPQVVPLYGGAPVPLYGAPATQN